MVPRRVVVPVLLIAVFSTAVYSFELESIDLRSSLTWIGNSDTSQGSEIDPVIVLPGLSFSFRLSDVVRFAPGLELSLDEYALVASGRAVPTQIETGSAVGPLAVVAGVAVSTPWYFGFFPVPELELAAAVSPTVYFRFPLLPIENTDPAAIGAYLLGMGRFLYPELRLHIGYRRGPTVAFALEGRALFPIFHIWDEEDLPFWDQLILGGSLSIRFFLDPSPEDPPPEDPPSEPSED